ncbi:uncharacterized protein LOC141600389 [Silene latifolia]|uniref:uncharacterized protein LOC141600389 n=1 Tax=Silene latifolia TaxID=37657 RepID=UPI003D7789F6
MAMKDVESEIEVDAGGSQTTNSIMRLHEVTIADAGGSLEGLRIGTLEDHINLVNRLRLKLLEKGDVEAIISKLYGDAAADPDLFFKVRRDESNMVVGLFGAILG